MRGEDAMNIILLGAAGFIGTNLTMKLAENRADKITLVDKDINFFRSINRMKFENVRMKQAAFDEATDFNRLLKGQDILYHLASTTVPSTSNQQIPQELAGNVIVTAKMLDACVSCGIRKVIFLSSGGTVYGREESCPLSENTLTNPINAYGIQKVTIEKLLYLYHYIYGLDYRVVRLANPYGPYQRPNGILGAVTTFTYQALRGEEIIVYGDGSVIRDYIYIDDAVRAILKIAAGESKFKTFNLGCGYGTSLKQVLETIGQTLQMTMFVEYKQGRKVDVPVNYLDISRYESTYGPLKPLPLNHGILRTAEFMRDNMDLSVCPEVHMEA